MGVPLLQLADPRFAPGTYGSEDYGTSTFGGSDYYPEAFTVQIGSDDLSIDLRRDRAGVKHQRYGVPVAARTWKNARIWKLNINYTTQEEIETLRVFFEASVFRLIPDSDNPDSYYNVYWVEDSFSPEQVKPGYYSISATFKETELGTSAPITIPEAPNQVFAGNLTITGDLDVEGEYLSAGTPLHELFAVSGHNHDHNTLTNLQGGNGSDEYYHVDQSTHDIITSSTEVTLEYPISLTSYLDTNTKFTEQDVHGAFIAVASAAQLDSGNDIDITKNTGKLVLVLNAGSDASGTITVTGTRVDRNTGVASPGLSEQITVDTLSTNNTSVGPQSIVVHDVVDGYITSYWYSGAVNISTTNLTLTDVDVYSISFEQFNDSPLVEVTTFDISAEPTNSAAWLWSYLYTVKPDGTGKVDIQTGATLSVPDGTATADQSTRLRRGNLGIELSGESQGVFVDLVLGPNNFTYWDDVTMKVWANKKETASAIVSRALDFDEMSNTTNVRTASLGFVFDGAGSDIETGTTFACEVPFDCTIQSWHVLSDSVGDIVFDVQKDTPPNYPPTTADSITGGSTPALTSADYASGTTGSWTTAVSAGDVVQFEAVSVSSVTRCTVQLKVLKD